MGKRKKSKKQFHLYVEDDYEPMAIVAREEDGSGWFWGDLRTPIVLGEKHGFATYQEALADVLSAMGLSSGEA